ncbi:MAG: hypothetical protein R3C61_26300 [Bacteroidia bacterium]
MVGDYSIKSGHGKSILRIDSTYVIAIPYYTVGDGYSIHWGRYKIRGRKIILLLDGYVLLPGNPPHWEKKFKSRDTYKMSPEGDLINKWHPNFSLYRNHSLSEDQRKLLEMAPSMVKNQNDL